jgi:hypothetical protein
MAQLASSLQAPATFMFTFSAQAVAAIVSQQRVFGRKRVAAKALCFPHVLISLAPFAEHVVVIVRHGSEPEVRGVHARRIVAAMANDHPRRNGPVGNLIGDTVCPADLEIDGDEPISAFMPTASPRPTVIWPALIHAHPKALRKSGPRCHSLKIIAERQWRG